MSSALVLGGQLDRIPGSHDDGTTDQILRTKLAQGELVKVPVHGGQFYAEEAGTSILPLQSSGITSNEDGTGTALSFQISQLVMPTLQGATMRTIVWGRVIGVRWRRDAAAQPFAVIIDGECFPVRDSLPRRNSQALSVTDTEALRLVADDLADGPHVVEVVGVASTAGTANWVLFGFIAERRAGYEPKMRLGQIKASATLTTSAVTVTTFGNATDPRAVAKILYFNTSASAVTVTIKNGSSVLKTLYLAATGSAGDSAEWDPGLPIATNSSITHQASTTGVVTASVIGAQ